MTSFEMATGNRRERPFREVAARILVAPFKRLLRAQREYLAVQHLRGLEHEQLDDIGLARGEIEAAVRGRRS